MSKLLDKLSSMLEENTAANAWSSTRFSFIFSVILSNVVLFSLIGYETVLTGKVPDVPEGAIWIYALANGISFAGKVSQKLGELKNSKNSDSSNTETKTEDENSKQLLNG